MKLAFLTTVTINMVVVSAADETNHRGFVHDLFGAVQLADVGAHCEGCQPDYCYPDLPGEEIDTCCYKRGVPKCCLKTKGNCPTGKKPDCECEDDCNSPCTTFGSDSKNVRGQRCFTTENDDANGNIACQINEYCLSVSGSCGDVVGRCRDLPTNNDCSDDDVVCGCDGVTYDNRCDAHYHGASVDHVGRCDSGGGGDRTTRCFTDDNYACENDEYCLAAVGKCETVRGLCKLLPTSNNCRDEPTDRVCGCNGVTYDNECDADYHGVSIDHEGRCDNSGGGDRTMSCFTNDNTACENDEYCLAAAGKCETVRGLCVSLPTNDNCDDDRTDWVCGCNDRSYRNDCEAKNAGVSIQYMGRCNSDTCRTDNNACDNDEYCRALMGRCENGEGRCMDLPNERCNKERSEPVCGCNDRTYDNECEALYVGVSIKYIGGCNSDTCSTDGDNCSRAEYCRAPMGRCENEEGRCMDLPNESCNNERSEPVCGCDGNDYDNECDAYYNGVSILHMGECN